MEKVRRDGPGIALCIPSLRDNLPSPFGLNEEHHFDAPRHFNFVLCDLAYGNGNRDVSKDTNLMAQRSLLECAQFASGQSLHALNEIFRLLRAHGASGRIERSARQKISDKCSPIR